MEEVISLDFDFSELNPAAIGVGVVFAGIVLVVMTTSTVGFFWKIMGVAIGLVAGYFIGLKNFG
jgi:hypothetical protein